MLKKTTLSSMKKVYTIGRDPQSDIVINDNTDVVSRLHATIRIEGSKMYLIDQSQNGTYVNGMRMSPNEEIPVSREDTISFANVVELDWTLLPDPKKAQMRTIGIVVAALIAIAAVVFSVLYFMDDKGKTTKEEQNTTITTDSTTVSNDEDENMVESDTIPVETVTTPEEPTPSTPSGVKKKEGSKEKKEEQPKEEKKETPKPENDIPLY